MNVLQRPAGGQEAGKYICIGSGYATNAVVSCCIVSISRGATPVSVSVDTVDTAPTGVGSPSTGHLTSSGFQVFAAATGAGTNIGCAGNYTIQY